MITRSQEKSLLQLEAAEILAAQEGLAVEALLELGSRAIGEEGKKSKDSKEFGTFHPAQVIDLTVFPAGLKENKTSSNNCSTKRYRQLDLLTNNSFNKSPTELEEDQIFFKKNFEDVNALYHKVWDSGNKQALAELNQLANQGIPYSFYCLAALYEEGKGIQQNIPEAIRLYMEAAKRGNSTAEYSLSVLANNGHAAAQYNWACLLEEGRIVKRDFAKAIQLYTSSVEKGYIKSLDRLILLCNEGNPLAKNILVGLVRKGILSIQDDNIIIVK